ncbi:MAG: helix-turn-helix domain-containing protein [Lachnospiraceae bacterium]|nr:helix-turn-helix domain-containing protein [Lachnospiraceae bacterium]
MAVGKTFTTEQNLQKSVPVRDESAESAEAGNISDERQDVVTLPDYLKYLRESHGYSQEVVADELHIIRQTYSHYECGRIVPPVNTLFGLAAFYDIPAEILIRIAEADYKRSVGDDSLRSLDDPDEWMDDIRVDLEVRPKDIRDYNAFIENNSKRYEKLRRDERCCLYYYNAVNDNNKANAINNMKIAKAMEDEHK